MKNQIYFDYKLKSKYTCLINIFNNIFLTVAVIFLVMYKLTIYHLVLLYFVSTIINSIILIYIFKKIFFLSFSYYLNLKTIKDIVHSSFPLGIAGISSLLYSKIDQVMIGRMLSMEDVGIYSIAAQLISGIMILIIPVQKSLYPKLINLFDKDKKLYYEKYLDITSISTILFFVAAIFLYFFFSYFFNFFF